MGANIRCIMRAKAPYGQGITKLKVKLTPEQSSTPSLMPETNSVYLTRPTEGTGELMELVGGSVAWNQLVQNGNFASTSNWSKNSTASWSVANNVLSLALSTSASSNRIYQALTLQSGHKYVIHADIKSSVETVGYFGLYSSNSASANPYTFKTTKQTFTAVVSATNEAYIVIGKSGTPSEAMTFEISNVYVIDLTQMLGPTIADYVYSLEQSTAGSGIAWLQQYGYFTEDYYAFSNPTLQSVEAISHVTKDADDNVLGTYALDSDLVLRGIPKLEDGLLIYDGDTYEPDGTVRRRFAVIDIGNTNWTLQNSNTTHNRFKASGFALCSDSYDNRNNFTDQAWRQGVAATSSTSNTNIIDVRTDGTLYLNVAKTIFDGTAAEFKTWGSGKEIVYALDESAYTTESADPFTAVQTVEDGGTEEFVTTNNVPVGVVRRFANAVPMEGVDSFTVTANDGTSHTYPVTLSEEIYRGYVDMLTGEAVSDMASIAEYNGETISEPWLSSLDVYSAGATPTNGAQVVYPITPEEVTATITGDPSELSGVVSAISTEGTVEWSELSEIGIKCIMKRKNPFQ